MNKYTTLLSVSVLAVAVSAAAQVPLRPDESQTIGRHLPSTVFTDENGDSLTLSTLTGKPLLLNPIFTRCEHVCPSITSTLRTALEHMGTPGQDFNVVTVSFDPADTPEDLRSYREKTELPAGWRLAIAEPDQLRTLLETIDFRYQPAPGGGFAHPNVVAVANGDMEITGYVHGMVIDEMEVRQALDRAMGVHFLSSRSPFFLLVMLAAAVLLAAFLVATTKKKTREA